MSQYLSCNTHLLLDGVHLALEPLDGADVELDGLRGDRRWLVRAGDGRADGLGAGAAPRTAIAVDVCTTVLIIRVGTVCGVDGGVGGRGVGADDGEEGESDSGGDV